jgi:hypothetical protein
MAVNQDLRAAQDAEPALNDRRRRKESSSPVTIAVDHRAMSRLHAASVGRGFAFRSTTSEARQCVGS